MSAAKPAMGERLPSGDASRGVRHAGRHPPPSRAPCPQLKPACVHLLHSRRPCCCRRNATARRLLAPELYSSISYSQRAAITTLVLAIVFTVMVGSSTWLSFFRAGRRLLEVVQLTFRSYYIGFLLVVLQVCASAAGGGCGLVQGAAGGTEHSARLAVRMACKGGSTATSLTTCLPKRLRSLPPAPCCTLRSARAADAVHPSD